MEYIIWGAGQYGIGACDLVGEGRVLCFADSYDFGKEWHRKKVISFNEMMTLYNNRDDLSIVIASGKYADEMERQLKELHLKRYCVYHPEAVSERLPLYYLYRKPIQPALVQLFSKINLSMYHCISIYGVNPITPFIIIEIKEQNPNAVIQLISNEYVPGNLDASSVSYDKAMDNTDCFILNVKRNEDDIRERLSDAGIDKRNIIDIYAYEQFEPAFRHPELSRYKDLHKGKRCFVIGTGPSLTIEDLNTLHANKEICISFNKIYRAYDRTPWRANYIGLSDARMIDDCSKELLNIPGEIFVADTFHNGSSQKNEHVIYYHGIFDPAFNDCTDFSDDFTTGFFNGGTVTYDFGLQFAAYLGISEIYLLGVDHSYSSDATEKGNHFIDCYFKEDEKMKYKKVGEFAKLESEKSYQKAEKYSRTHGFRIFNATRGGKLEIFERRDFDTLF